MILDEKKVSKLLGDNKEDDKMEYEHKSNSNTYVMPNNDQRFWEYLFAYGIIDKNGNKVQNASTEQVTSLATQFGMTASEMGGKIDRFILAQCEQTGTITNAIHTSSTANLVGQNTLGEKVSENSYKALIDGGVTRKNDDDNTKYLSNQNTLGFHGVEKNISALEARMSSQHCDTKSEIKEAKYDLDKTITASSNRSDMQFMELKSYLTSIDKDNQIRASERETARVSSALEETRYNNLLDHFHRHSAHANSELTDIKRIMIGNNFNIGSGHAGADKAGNKES